MRLSADYNAPSQVHSFQKVEGLFALERSEIIEEEPMFVGDLIRWYSLPDGKLLVCKSKEGTPISRISSAYLYLEADITVEEK